MKHVLYSLTFILLATVLLFNSCSDNNEAPIPTPSITSFTPTHGLVGSAVIITGENFSAIPTENVLKFNGIAATVTNATTSQLTTTIPVGATTGKLSLTVSGNTFESAVDFTVDLPVAPKPTIASFTPAHGLVGATVIITGTNFSATPAQNILKFNGVTGTVTNATTTQLTTTIPVGATTGKLSLTVSGSTIESTSNFIVDPPVVAVSCLLTKFTVVGSGHADSDLNTTWYETFEYNDKGELIKTTDVDGYETITTYTYVSGLVTEVKSVDIYETVIEKWTYNANKLVSHIAGTIKDEDDTYTYTKDFIYDGTKKLISIKRLTDANTNYLMTFTYTGNNVTKYVAKDIDLDKEFENGTYADFDTKKNPFLLLAKATGNQAFYISEVTSADMLSANNAKTVNIKERGGESTSVYEYDTNDNVKKQTITYKAGGKYVVTYEYKCN